MSCTLSHECRVMLIAELLTASTDATRGWLRAEMDRTVDPMLDSIFNRLKTKLTNGLERTQSGEGPQVGNLDACLHDQSANVQIHQPSTSSHFNPQFVNMNYSYQRQQNDPNHLNSISNQQLSSQPMMIKKEIEPMTNEQIPTHQVQSCSYAPVSNEQSNHNLTDQHSIKEEEDELDNDEYDQLDEESSRPVKIQRMDKTQPNNAQKELGKQKQSTDEAQSNEDRPGEKGDRLRSEQSEDNDTRSTCKDNFHDKSIVISLERSDTSNAIEEECPTNPIQANLAQTNRHLQCSHCHKSFDRPSTLERHVRVHTGERQFQCDQCDKRFKEKNKLGRHQLIHQNVKHFQCDQCGKQFTRKDHLDIHLLIHSGERPFECRHCEQSFTTSVNRKRHEQAIHLHVKPYRCKQCGHSATHRSGVNRHIREVHFGLPRTIKQRRALNIIDDRDPRELVETV